LKPNRCTRAISTLSTLAHARRGRLRLTFLSPPMCIFRQWASRLRLVPQATTPTASHAEDQKPGVIAAAPNGTLAKLPSLSSLARLSMAAMTNGLAPGPSDDASRRCLKGFQWFKKFTYRASQPHLAYFVLNVSDRDVPLDVDIFNWAKTRSGQPDVVPYNDGQFVYQIEATQNYPVSISSALYAATRRGVLRARRCQSPGVSAPHL